MCHRLYFKPTTSRIVCRFRILDFTIWTRTDFKNHTETYQIMEFWSLEDQDLPSDVICIDEGYGAHDRNLWPLDRDCEMTEQLSKAGESSAIPVEDFLSNLKEQYETLRLNPVGSRITIEGEKVPEREGKERITLNEVNRQTQEWRTDQDV